MDELLTSPSLVSLLVIFTHDLKPSLYASKSSVFV